MKRYLGLLLFVMLNTGVPAQGQVGSRDQLGPPPAPPIILAPRPPQPTRFHIWIEGYWQPFGNEYTWYNGDWIVPPYYGARWIPPHYDPRTDRYYHGYWNGDRLRQYSTYHYDWYSGSQYVTSDDHFDGLLSR
jgi:hypothetical protein